MNDLLFRSKMFVKRNSSILMSIGASVGVVGTAVLTAKATPKVLSLIEEAKAEKGEELTPLETVQVAAPAYVPAILTGAATIACIFGVHGVNKRNQASLLSAYGLLDSSYKSYKEKVRELYGDDADTKVKQAVVKDAKSRDLPPEVKGKELFFDYFSGRYFNSTMEEVLRAEYMINRIISLRDYAYVNEFYDMLGIPFVDGGFEIGWSEAGNRARYWQSWIDFTNEKTVLDDGLECYIVTMFQEPYANFADYED